MGLFNKKSTQAGRLDMEKLPRHVAVIMDGNGRWAKKRGLPRTAGHAAGAEVFRRIATYCSKLGIEYLTVYAFSTENWKRPSDEVEAIMALFEKYLHEAIEKMEKENVRLRVLGDTSRLSPEIRALIEETAAKNDRITGMQANICINYGGRSEILRAAKAAAADAIRSGLELDCEMLEKHLYTSGIPDPDLIIRPSGEKRLSNFLLWQSAYSELYFTDALWPDFTERELDRAIIDYQSRNRRYGGIQKP